MKNLSSIPRLSLFEAFTILITLAVCLAAFTEAEVQTNLRKLVDENYNIKEGSMGDNIPYSHKTVKQRGGELQQPDVKNVNNFPGGSLEKLIKRQSDDFGESADSESDKENDGYGYDDDEYYHLNYKRNEDAVGNLEGIKMNKGEIGETNKKEGITSPFGTKLSNGKSQKENEKEIIEMLNFKEFHPNVENSENPNSNQNSKQSPYESSHKKIPASPLNSLNMRDLKENSAIDEKMKKEEGAGVLASGSTDPKVAENKKSIKTEEKDVKIKDAKITEDSEKKEKEASLKDVKENVANKNLKETAKSADEKEKNLKLSESAKLEDNLEKLNSKNKDGETAKITKEDKDNSKLIGKGDVDVINPNDISQISSRANFVSNDYKYNMKAIKPAESEDDEKDSEDISDGEKNLSISDLRGRQEKLRERHLIILDGSQGNDKGSSDDSAQETNKDGNFIPFPVSFEVKNENENDYFKKRASWKDHGKFHFPEQSQQMQQEQQMPTQEQQQQPQMTYDRDTKNSYHLKFPPGELENTEYHKNFIKSLKRYKNLNENVKVLNPELPSTSNSVEKPSSFQKIRETRKKKRSKPKKRRSMKPEDENKSETTRSKLRRNIYRSEKRWCPPQREDFEISQTKTDKDDSKLLESKKLSEQQELYRQRRKSPAKLEYEIKIINQNQQDSRNAPLSSLRTKKDVKTKLSTDEKYVKKYPYSQVNRDDITRIEVEKKYKRKAPIWMNKDLSKDSVVQTRGLPSGYYGNRVKFGQKSYARTDEKSNPDQSDMNKITYLQTPIEKNSGFQRGWELKPQDYKHDPMKRYDPSNSLLLIKKGQNGERITKSFEEAGSKEQEERVDTEHLAKLLSKDNDYLILKKTDDNKYRKVSEPEEGLNKQEESNLANQVKKDSLESEPQEKLSLKKGVYTRSSHKEEKKYSSGLHTKSNLKKTFEKFRDLADFFKENEPEAADSNQYQNQEVKEGRDIVFSEDKLPDPIVISNDPTKSDSYSQKPTNSIYSISNNFKHLDQQDRKEEERKEGELNKNMLTAEMKSDNQEFSWEPALKNAFPEAKSINSISKNGNEIIVLDFNRNQLKNEHAFLPGGKGNPKSQPMSGGSGSRLLNTVEQRQVEVVLPSKLNMLDKTQNEDKLGFGASNGPYAVFNAADGQTQVSVPLNQLAQIPGLFKNFAGKKQNSLEGKSAKKKSVRTAQDPGSENYNQFLKDLRELSDMNKKGKLSSKRNTKEILLPASSFPELTGYSDVNIKKLGNLLASILTSENDKQPTFESLKPSYSKSEQWYPAAYDVRRQNQWSSEVKNNEPHVMNKENTLQSEMKEDIENILRTDGEKNYQEKIREEFAGSSDKIQRLRREGKRKMRKANGNTQSFRDSSNEENKCPISVDNKCMIKLPSNALNSKDNDDMKLKEGNENNESIGQSKLLKSDYEDHLNELFENLSSNKNQKDQLNFPIENTPNRAKRKDNDRRKRSTRRDVKNNVSTTEVQNRILKNLPEDNYSSIYSPGIKRRLLSTENDAEDADGYYGADNRDGSEMAETNRANCAKNAKNIDPIILELFGAERAAGDKNRDRRSLTSGFHSNFKREIDLDESMPNDFQNFLVTSLGGFGSQKREVVKKEEAFWDGKESSQENYNQIVESSPVGKDASDDSALEKREVPSEKNHKTQKYKSSNYFEPRAESNKKSASRSEKMPRSGDSSMDMKTSEFEDKVPTKIRIQITNAVGKEKKSSKPIMDESETTSTEMENVPKEKEFFDKNKANQIGLSSLPKIHQFAKPKFSPFDRDEYGNLEDKPKLFPPRPYRWRRRKKKKYVPENPMKPVKDFIAFDQKAMEILLRKYMADQNLSNEQQSTTQRIPMSNHLPQVETVYNPTQGTNKAQFDTSRLTKINSASNKNADNAKNSLQANETPTFDERSLLTYLKSKQIKKNEKVYGKEFEDADWKCFSGKLKSRTDNLQENANDLSFKNFAADTASFSNNPTANSPDSHYMNPFTQGQLDQKLLQDLYENNLYHSPNPNIMNSNSLYDALKLKQELKNNGISKVFMSKDHAPMKSSQKPFYFTDNNIYNKLNDKNKNFNYPTTAEPPWNTYDYNFNKKPLNQKLKSPDLYASAIKNPADTRSKAAFAPNNNRLNKRIELSFDAMPSQDQDASKDSDCLDALENDYFDEDTGKELEFDEPIITDSIRKPSKIYDPRNLHHINFYRNSDNDDDPSDVDEEFEDDYDKSSDDDEIDDYSLLMNSKEGDQEFPKNQRTATFQGTEHPEDNLLRFSQFYPKSNKFDLKGTSFEQMEYNNPKVDEKFGPGRQTVSFGDMKNNIDPIASSTNILKKANENSNIFGKNLMKNLNKYNYDERWRDPEKLQDERSSIDLYPKYGRKIRKRKMIWLNKPKRNKEYSQIGSRFFYVAKAEMPDKSESPPGSNTQAINRRQNQFNKVPLTAQFAASDNDFEYESENNQKRINGINVHESVEEVQENLEDNGENISEDNVLENIIGKYIMRKRVQSSPSDAFGKEKKLHKRSTGPEKPCKMLEKRLSSGHLTENNFKKFHKKNLLTKRHVVNAGITTRQTLHGKETPRRTRGEQDGQNQEKRSALDLFKKITSKDKDARKSETQEAHNAGFEPLLTLSEKKPPIPSRDSDETSKAQSKKLTAEDRTNLKPHWSNVRGKDDLSDQKKEKSLNTARGPWKLELNDRWNHRGYDKGLVVSSQENDDKEPKTYFIVSQDEKRAKRKFQGGFSAAGSSRTEVGTSYRPKVEEGKKSVRKRSLKPIKVREKDAHDDAAQASLKKPISENLLTIQQHNRALHDTQSLSEGDSDPQPPHVLQSNSNINGSFVTDDDKSPRFLSKGKLRNLKSVFPTLSDANIFRDNRDINEGASEYLSQRIVEAILSQVSANAKFKELIAPGLVGRTSLPKENIDQKRRATHNMDFNDQLQSFLQKFMSDLQKLAEQHVKKRMCNEIDKQSKQFLQSLLNVPAEKNNNEFDNNEMSSSTSNDVHDSSSVAITKPITLEASQPSPSTQQQQQQEFQTEEKLFANLRKKQNLLKKLISEYQNLSKLEQETLNVNYRYLLRELDDTNKELAFTHSHPCLTPNNDCYETSWSRKTKHRKNYKNEGFESITNGTVNTESEKPVPNQHKKHQQHPTSTPPPFLPTYVFSPLEQDNTTESPKPVTTTPSNTYFENVYSNNMTFVGQSATSSPTSKPDPHPFFYFNSLEEKTEASPVMISDKELSSQVSPCIVSPTTSVDESPKTVTESINPTTSPQTFDLLGETSSNLPTINLEPNSVRIKQLAPQKDKNSNDWEYHGPQYPEYDSANKQSALHTLNTGDAAGLQLSLKTRDPWVSTLDVAKTLRSIPTGVVKVPKQGISENIPMMDLKRGRSFFAPKNYFIPSSKLYGKTTFPYRIDKKIYTRKVRPFLKAMRETRKFVETECQLLPFHYVPQKYPVMMKKPPYPTHGLDSRRFDRKKKRKIVAKWHRRRFSHRK